MKRTRNSNFLTILIFTFLILNIRTTGQNISDKSKLIGDWELLTYLTWEDDYTQMTDAWEETKTDPITSQDSILSFNFNNIVRIGNKKKTFFVMTKFLDDNSTLGNSYILIDSVNYYIEIKGKKLILHRYSDNYDKMNNFTLHWMYIYNRKEN